MQHPIGPVDELRRERCRVVDIAGHRIGVIYIDGRFFAVRDRCPHRPANICEGTVGGTFRASAPHELLYAQHQRVIRCPWHGWEFDLETGRSLLEPQRFGLKIYPVTVRGGTVFVHTEETPHRSRRGTNQPDCYGRRS